MTKRRRKGSQGFLTTASDRANVALGIVWGKLVYNDIASILCRGGNDALLVRFLMCFIAAVSSFSFPVTEHSLIEWVLDAHSAEKRVLIGMEVAQRVRAMASISV